MIIERRNNSQKLDPRIYPSWWGEENLDSIAHQKIDETNQESMKESSLERGMREIKQTAQNLEQKLMIFQNYKTTKDGRKEEQFIS